MQLSTAQDALTALQQADNDVVAFQKQVDVPANSSTTILGMYAVTNNILSELNAELANLAGDDPTTPLSAQDLSAISQIQTDIVNGRAIVGAEITAADWSLGGIFDTVGTGIKNLASDVGASFHINWTLIVIVAVLAVGFIVFIKVV